MIVSSTKFTTLQKKYKDNFASLAGFSGDIGDFGARLTYDPKCSIKPFNKMYGASNCTGFKGASGGPVVLTVSKKGRQKHYIVGVVSHFKHKDFRKIFFAPQDIFYKYVKKACKL